jgi:predicted dienelactone hydrolase
MSTTPFTRRPLTRLLASAALAAAAWALSATPAAAQVGLQRAEWTVPAGEAAAPQALQALLWYPSPAVATPQRFGPYQVAVAPGAPATPGAHPLVLLSHGTGGHEMGHAWLARRLAEQGFVVLSLRHPGDHFQDRSGVARPDYLAERPRQLSRALDALLADPQWAPLVDAGRVAAVGHSAGGHTVLALAGGQPDRVRLVNHCSPAGRGLAEDAALCALAGFSAAKPAPVLAAGSAPLPSVRDPRVRAVVAVAPLGLGLDQGTLARDVAVPVLLEASRRDEVLAFAHHAGPLCAALPKARCVVDDTAGHHALFQAGTGPLGAPGLDPAWDPAGFDRAAWQAEAGPRIVAFLQDQLR